MHRLFSHRTFAALAALLSFVVYLLTLAPGVDFIDAGELATVASTLGIAHPTGYPLFTLIGWVFSQLPIASTVIARLNIMSALFTALASGGAVLLSYEILTHWIPAKLRKVVQQKKGKSTPPPEPEVAESWKTETLIAALVTGLTLAFSETWWSQSTAIEVYPLHLFLSIFALVFFRRMLRKEEGSDIGINGLLFALSLGLAFTNHLTTILLAPAMLYAYFARYGLSSAAFRRIGKLALPFAAALLVYLYLPIRSSANPIMDWGHPADFSSFLKHVTGGQYKVWMFTGSGAAAKNWSYFWSDLPTEIAPYLGLVIAALGIALLAKSAKRNRVSVLVFTLLLFLGCLFYSINYDIHDIDSYFLLSYLVVGIWIGAGVLWLSKYFEQKAANTERRSSFAALALILPLLELGMNWKSIDESGNHMVDDYTRNMLVNLPPNAIIFSSLWDFWVSGSFYYQLVENLRPDILVIDKPMLRDRPWYFEHLRERAPEVMRRVEPELATFMKYLVPFDRGEPFDETAIGPAYQEFTSALVGKNLDRPIFVAVDLVQDDDDLFARGFKRVPAGVAFRLLPDSLSSANLSVPLPKLVWRDTDYRKRSYFTDNARLRQALPLAAYAEDAAKRGDLETARAFIHLANSFAPHSQQLVANLPSRDKEIAQMTDENFSRMREFEQSLAGAK